jgi:hypothetical protein
MRKPKVKTVLYMYEHQMKALKKRADKLDEPVSKLVRDAITLYLRQS